MDFFSRWGQAGIFSISGPDMTFQVFGFEGETVNLSLTFYMTVEEWDHGHDDDDHDHDHDHSHDEEVYNLTGESRYIGFGARVTIPWSDFARAVIR